LQLIYADGIYANDYLPIRILAAFNFVLEIVRRALGRSVSWSCHSVGKWSALSLGWGRTGA
jgi:hypothetical protein